MIWYTRDYLHVFVEEEKDKAFTDTVTPSEQLKQGTCYNVNTEKGCLYSAHQKYGDWVTETAQFYVVITYKFVSE